MHPETGLRFLHAAAADCESCDYGDEKEGILAVSEEMSRGKEKTLVLTESGKEYSERLLHSLSLMEERAAERLGAERIRMMTELFMEYDQVMENALEEEE